MSKLDQFDLYQEKMKEISEFMNSDIEDDIDFDEIMDELGVDFNEVQKAFDEYTPQLELGYTKLNENAKDPFYNYKSDSGFDLYSTEEIVIPSFGRVLVPTGLSFDIKDGYEIQVRSKSGLAIKQGLMVLNSPGTVDCFSEDMKILTIDGNKKISEVNIGDIVFSFNEDTLEIEKDTITHIFNTEEQEIIQIETDEGILEVTPNSEVYTKNGIILAKNLKIDDEVISFF